MNKPRVTIVVSPRERFSYSQESLESLYKNTDIPFELIYIDGNSPDHIRHYLEKQSKEKAFKLVRTNHYLRPNQARNLSLPHVKTDYVVFVDNDLIVEPNWLQALLQCADDTGAWIVGPLYLEGLSADKVIHMFGGAAHFREIQGQKKFFEKHRYRGQKLSHIQADLLQREKTETVEFHCTLTRMDVIEKLGAFDEGLKTACEHLDFALSVRDAGGEVYVEPTSIVTYVTPPPFEWYDFPFFLWRWSDRANQDTINHFCSKWNISSNGGYGSGILRWCKSHRYLAWKPLETRYRRLFPKRGGVKLVNIADRLSARLVRMTDLITSKNYV